MEVARLLLVHEDEDIVLQVSSLCSQERYELRQLASLSDLEPLLRQWRPHVILIDLVFLDQLPSATLAEICTPSGPVLFVLSAMASVHDVRRVFALGAEDFLRIPCDPAELRARLKVGLRTREAIPPEVHGPYRVAVQGGRLRLSLPNRRWIDLSPLEARLMRRFLLTPNVPVARQELLRVGWGWEAPDDDNALEASIRRLRCKIEKDPDRPRTLLTARGLGYSFNPAAG
ncbi:MAG TPA: response regulator transcription factor [Chloroflexota bacterium]|nr:response regulator transcription factor [Chloroflexota bacterium]